MQSHERLSTMSKQIPVEVGFTFYYTDKRLKYTSKEIHTPHGFDYAVCENCYDTEREIEKRWKNK